MKKMMLWQTVMTFFILCIVNAASGAGLSDTGQDKCYDNSGEIPCPTLETDEFYGQDAQYSSQNNFVPQSFTKLDENGIPLADTAESWAMVRDNVTGLIWEVKTEINASEKYNWSDAVSYCENLSIGSFSDWRLPTIEEFVSIADYGKNNPAINTEYFPNIQSGFYWSSEEVAGTFDAWYYNYANGTSAPKGIYYSYYTTAVRCGNSIPKPYVKENSNGTVTDFKTGLTWYVPDDTLRTWTEALDVCKNLTIANEDRSWRMPNIKELYSIIQKRINIKDNTSTSIAELFNISTSNLYWSSTTNTDLMDSALNCRGTSVLKQAKSSSFFKSKTIAVTGGDYGTFAAKGDVNKDSKADLADAITVLQICAGNTVFVDTYFGLDNINVDADTKIGLPEAIYVLQEIAGLYHCN